MGDSIDKALPLLLVLRVSALLAQPQSTGPRPQPHASRPCASALPVPVGWSVSGPHGSSGGHCASCHWETRAVCVSALLPDFSKTSSQRGNSRMLLSASYLSPLNVIEVPEPLQAQKKQVGKLAPEPAL